jgi:hypothetical protein
MVKNSRVEIGKTADPKNGLPANRITKSGEAAHVVLVKKSTGRPHDKQHR